MTTDALWRPTSALSDAQLEAEVAGLRTAADREALADPATLAAHLDRNYRRRRHLDAISDAIARLTPGGGGRLLIVTPPQVGKSITTSVWGPFWWLAHHPTHKIICASYATALAIKRGRAVRSLVHEHGASYDLKVLQGVGMANDWQLVTGGGMRSVGVDSGLTGHDADLMVMDDPHKDRAEADSPRMRESVWDWCSAVAMSRLSPRAPAILIQTRWHPDDLAGRLLAAEGRVEDGGRWQVIHLPAVAGPSDYLGRAPGEPLTHPKIRPSNVAAAADHWADKRASSSVRDWHALYQGDPQPAEGALVTYDLMRDRRHPTPTALPVKIAVAVDPSGGGRDTAGIVAGYLATDQRLYITDDRTCVASADTWSREAAQLAIDVDADRIIVESNYGGDMAILVVRTAWEALRAEGKVPAGRLCPRIESVHAKRGKLLRAEPIAAQWVEDRIRTVGYLPELEQEWCTWISTDPDSPGRIDASVYLAYGLLPIPGIAAKVISPAKVSISGMTGGRPTGMTPRTPRRPGLR